VDTPVSACVFAQDPLWGIEVNGDLYLSYNVDADVVEDNFVKIYGTTFDPGLPTGARTNDETATYLGMASGGGTIYLHSGSTSIGDASLTLTNARVLLDQHTSIGGAGDDAVALELDGALGTFLPPRFTTTDRVALGAVPDGSVVFDTTLGQPCYYFSGTWSCLFVPYSPFTLPVMTSPQRALLAGRVDGTLVLDSDLNKLCYYSPAGWYCIDGAIPTS
jgi:hypothetical protein